MSPLTAVSDRFAIASVANALIAAVLSDASWAELNALAWLAVSFAAWVASSEAKVAVERASIFPDGIAATASVDRPARAEELIAAICADVNKFISAATSVPA